MTFASGLAQSFKALLGIRAAVGIGEASYAPAATAMISDAFPEGHRAQAQGVWNAGMFIGGTLGAMIGGSIIALFGNWRIAFFLVAIPGALLAWMASRLPEKKREHREPFHIKELLTNIPYLFIVGSSILLSFAAGSYISWGIEFVVRYKGFSVGSASLLLGLDMMVAGLMGVVIGSIVADHWHTKGAWGRSLVVAISLILAAPFMFLGIWSPGESISFFVYFFIGTVLLAAYHGPATAVIHDIVPERARATAFAMYLFVGHLLGDTLAPAAIGFISDSAGLLRGLEYATILVFFGGILFLPVAWYAGAAIERAKKT
jgi:MFS family permease